MTRFVTTASFVGALLCVVSVTSVSASDTEMQEQLCLRLSKSADSPGTWRAASNTCIQAAVGRKDRADRASGPTQQHEQLFEAAFMVMAAQAESHGGDPETRSGLLAKAKEIARSVRARALSPSIKADAARLVNDIQRMQ